MVYKFSINTTSRTEFIDVTLKIRSSIRDAKIDAGICYIFIPHTTAGITINENADPAVIRDILKSLEELVPFKAKYTHGEGNSAAHIKSTIVGIDKTVLIENGELKLGTWQGIFFCEFDGPRQRDILIKVSKE